MKNKKILIIGICVIIVFMLIPFVQNKIQYNNLYETTKVYDIDDKYSEHKLIVSEDEIEDMKNDIFEIQKEENNK